MLVSHSALDLGTMPLEVSPEDYPSFSRHVLGSVDDEPLKFRLDLVLMRQYRTRHNLPCRSNVILNSFVLKLTFLGFLEVLIVQYRHEDLDVRFGAKASLAAMSPP